MTAPEDDTLTAVATPEKEHSDDGASPVPDCDAPPPTETKRPEREAAFKDFIVRLVSLLPPGSVLLLLLVYSLKI